MLEIFLAVFIIISDQAIKYISVQYLKPLGSVEVIPGVFNFSYVENRGAAFGILQNQRWLFIGLTIVIGLGIAYYLITHRGDSLLRRVSLALIMGGAVGNLIDRIYLGYVVDMFHFTWRINFAVFNVADMTVVIGTFLLAYQLLFLDKPGEVRSEAE